jgi:hypothetical protein
MLCASKPPGRRYLDEGQALFPTGCVEVCAQTGAEVEDAERREHDSNPEKNGMEKPLLEAAENLVEYIAGENTLNAFAS